MIEQRLSRAKEGKKQAVHHRAQNVVAADEDPEAMKIRLQNQQNPLLVRTSHERGPLLNPIGLIGFDQEFLEIT